MNVLNLSVFAACVTVCFCNHRSLHPVNETGTSMRLTCIVLNAQRMNCSWSSNVPFTGDLHMFFSSKCDKECVECTNNYEPCPLQVHNTCLWGETGDNRFLYVYQYCLRLVDKRDSETTGTSYIWTVPIRDIVKPAPVSLLQVINRTSTSLLVVWTKPDYISEFLVRLNYTSPCTHSSLLLKSQTHAHVVNLVPSSDYTLSVEIRPWPRGYWSDAMSLVITTQPDVAGENPTVGPGSFTVYSHSYDSHTRTVHVFWQPVPVCRRHDVVYSVTVEYRAVTENDSVWESRVMGGDETSVRLTLSSLISYEVLVKSRTSAGFNTSLHDQPLYISNDTQHVNVMSSYNGSSVLVSWWPLSGAVQYTVYWCQRRLHTCHDAVKWRHVESESFVIDAPRLQLRRQSMMVAVSAEFNSSSRGLVSTGMHWSRCIYNTTASVKSPSVIQPVIRHGRLIVSWREPPCHETDYIQSYIVRYCQRVTSECWVVEISAPKTRLEIDDITVDGEYCVDIMSSSSLENSSFSQPACTVPVVSYHDGSVLIVIPIVIGVVICLTTLLLLIRYLRKTVAIKPPDKAEFNHDEVTGCNVADESSEMVAEVSTLSDDPPTAGEFCQQQRDSDVADDCQHTSNTALLDSSYNVIRQSSPAVLRPGVDASSSLNRTV